MKTAETKYKMLALENVGLYHDRGTSNAGALTSNEGALIFNPWYQIAKGTDSSNRIGDEIYCRGMSIRLMGWSTPGRAAQYIRIIVAVIPKTVGSTITDGSNYDLLDAFGSNDTVTGMIKKEGVKVLYDRTITCKPMGSTDTTATSGDTRFFRRLYIKSKKGQKIGYQQDGNLVNKPVGVWVIPYDEYSSLRTDQLLSVSYTCKMYFKDV